MCFGSRSSPPPPAPVPTPMPAPMAKVKAVENPALAKRKRVGRRKAGGMKSLRRQLRVAPKGGFAGAGTNVKTYNV